MCTLVCVEDKVSKSDEIKDKNIGNPTKANAVRYEETALCMNELSLLISIEEAAKHHKKRILNPISA